MIRHYCGDMLMLASLGLRRCSFATQGPVRDQAAFIEAARLTAAAAANPAEWLDDARRSVIRARDIFNRVNPGIWPLIPPAWHSVLGSGPDLTVPLGMGASSVQAELEKEQPLPLALKKAFNDLRYLCGDRLDHLRWMNGPPPPDEYVNDPWDTSLANPNNLPNLADACEILTLQMGLWPPGLKFILRTLEEADEDQAAHHD